jgi:hypothetical protein
VELLLQANGARIVEGPGSTGIFGVAPADIAPGQSSSVKASREMQILQARLRADPRVRWVEPLAVGETTRDEREPIARGP